MSAADRCGTRVIPGGGIVLLHNACIKPREVANIAARLRKGTVKAISLDRARLAHAQWKELADGVAHAATWLVAVDIRHCAVPHAAVKVLRRWERLGGGGKALTLVENAVVPDALLVPAHAVRGLWKECVVLEETAATLPVLEVPDTTTGERGDHPPPADGGGGVSDSCATTRYPAHHTALNCVGAPSPRREARILRMHAEDDHDGGPDVHGGGNSNRGVGGHGARKKRSDGKGGRPCGKARGNHGSKPRGGAVPQHAQTVLLRDAEGGARTAATPIDAWFGTGASAGRDTIAARPPTTTTTDRARLDWLWEAWCDFSAVVADARAAGVEEVLAASGSSAAAAATLSPCGTALYNASIAAGLTWAERVEYSTRWLAVVSKVFDVPMHMDRMKSAVVLHAIADRSARLIMLIDHNPLIAILSRKLAALPSNDPIRSDPGLLVRYATRRYIVPLVFNIILDAADIKPTRLPWEALVSEWLHLMCSFKLEALIAKEAESALDKLAIHQAQAVETFARGFARVVCEHAGRAGAGVDGGALKDDGGFWSRSPRSPPPPPPPAPPSHVVALAVPPAGSEVRVEGRDRGRDGAPGHQAMPTSDSGTHAHARRTTDEDRVEGGGAVPPTPVGCRQRPATTAAPKTQTRVGGSSTTSRARSTSRAGGTATRATPRPRAPAATTTTTRSGSARGRRAIAPTSTDPPRGRSQSRERRWGAAAGVGGATATARSGSHGPQGRRGEAAARTRTPGTPAGVRGRLATTVTAARHGGSSGPPVRKPLSRSRSRSRSPGTVHGRGGGDSQQPAGKREGRTAAAAAAEAMRMTAETPRASGPRVEHPIHDSISHVSPSMDVSAMYADAADVVGWDAEILSAEEVRAMHSPARPRSVAVGTNNAAGHDGTTTLIMQASDTTLVVSDVDGAVVADARPQPVGRAGASYVDESSVAVFEAALAEASGVDEHRSDGDDDVHHHYHHRRREYHRHSASSDDTPSGADDRFQQATREASSGPTHDENAAAVANPMSGLSAGVGYQSIQLYGQQPSDVDDASDCGEGHGIYGDHDHDLDGGHAVDDACAPDVHLYEEDELVEEEAVEETETDSGTVEGWGDPAAGAQPCDTSTADASFNAGAPTRAATTAHAAAAHERSLVEMLDGSGSGSGSDGGGPRGGPFGYEGRLTRGPLDALLSGEVGEGRRCYHVHGAEPASDAAAVMHAAMFAHRHNSEEPQSHQDATLPQVPGGDAGHDVDPPCTHRAFPGGGVFLEESDGAVRYYEQPPTQPSSPYRSRSPAMRGAHDQAVPPQRSPSARVGTDAAPATTTPPAPVAPLQWNTTTATRSVSTEYQGVHARDPAGGHRSAPSDASHSEGGREPHDADDNPAMRVPDQQDVSYAYDTGCDEDGPDSPAPVVFNVVLEASTDGEEGGEAVAVAPAAASAAPAAANPVQWNELNRPYSHERDFVPYGRYSEWVCRKPPGRPPPPPPPMVPEEARMPPHTTPPARAYQGSPPLRFGIGRRVRCTVALGVREAGTVVAQWEMGHAYRVRLDSGRDVYAKADTRGYIVAEE